MAIWIVSYPRSGNSYFRVLLQDFYNIRTFSLSKENASPPHFALIGNTLNPDCVEKRIGKNHRDAMGKWAIINLLIVNEGNYALKVGENFGGTR